jgi:Ca2+-binding RTX toxin-like protein
MSGATIPGAAPPGLNETLYWSGTAWVGAGGGSTLADAFWGRDTGSTAQVNNSYTGTTNPTFADGRGGNDTLNGGAGNDILVGSDGTDSLSGGADADTLIGDSASVGGTLGSPTFSGIADDGDTDNLAGGAGDDTYILASSQVVISEGSNAGIDTVLVTGNATSIQLADNLENLRAFDPSQGGGLTLIGQQNQVLANSITGAAGNDSLNGRAGDDTLSGLAGNDTLLGSEGNNSLVGGAGNDSMIAGTDANGASTMLGEGGRDTLLGQNGTYTVDGGADDDYIGITGGASSVLGGDGADSISSGDGSDTIDGGTGNDTILAANGANSLVGGGGNDSILGGNGADRISVSGNSTVNADQGDDIVSVGPGGAASVNGAANNADILAFNFSGNVTISGVTGGGNDYNFTYASANGTGTALNFRYIRDSQGNLLAPTPGEVTVCFAEGTDILTAHGEVRVETLRAGDVVATLSGRGAPIAPVLWVGRRRIVLAGNPAAGLLAPIRIAAGALGDNAPTRDLLVSPDHCLFLDGALVPARLLVNGETIAVEHGLAEVTYFHVELAAHDVLLANGAAAESWLDAGNRHWFANAAVALLSVADAPDAYACDAVTPCAEVVQGGPRLAAIRDAIALRGAARRPPERRRAAG